jgi:hypothetical protein
MQMGVSEILELRAEEEDEGRVTRKGVSQQIDHAKFGI